MDPHGWLRRSWGDVCKHCKRIRIVMDHEWYVVTMGEDIETTPRQQR